ncbi:MAG: HD domain-containing phosphohydrolase [Patescibacteria group bacterium]|jgi:HD-GYP domain-containing protein (c-di-GMP phosphodiesterase class II)
MKSIAEMTPEELRAEIARQTLLRELELILHNNWDLKQAVQLTLETIHKAFGTAGGSLMLLEPDQRLRIWASSGIDPEIVRSVNQTGIALGQGIAGQVLQRGESVILNSHQDPAFENLMERPDIYLSACFPLIGKRGKILGVLSINAANETTLGSNEIAILADITPGLADAIQHQQEVKAVQEFSRILQAAEQPTQLHWALTRVNALLGLSSITLIQPDAEQQRLSITFDTSRGEAIPDQTWPLQPEQASDSPVVKAYFGEALACETVTDVILPETLQNKPALFLPLLSEDGGERNPLGVLVISPIPADQVEIGKTLASTLTIALKSTLNLQRAQSFLHDLLGVLAVTIDSKSPFTSFHCKRVEEVGEAVAKVMDLPPEEAKILKQAAMLHDLGKVVIDNGILNKNGELTPDEWNILKHHPITGEGILSQASGLAKEVALVCLSHHMNEDGNGGYPDGLSCNTELPRIVKIIRVADSFDAMVSDRPYRKGMPPLKAAFELMRCSDRQFNRQVVKCFILAIIKGIEVTIPKNPENKATTGKKQKRLIKLEPDDIHEMRSILMGLNQDQTTGRVLAGKRVDTNPEPGNRDTISTDLATFFLPLFSK